MIKDEYQWLESIENLSDKRVVLYISCITKALEDEMRETVETMLREKLAGLKIEAMKRGLSYE